MIHEERPATRFFVEIIIPHVEKTGSLSSDDCEVLLKKFKRDNPDFDKDFTLQGVWASASTFRLKPDRFPTLLDDYPLDLLELIALDRPPA